MKVHDLVSFSKESFFNGAVQTEWFYDSEKIKAISASYVFHGPKYYGVSSEDVKSGEHRLMDTASFAKNIADKLYSKYPGNSFVMTIAGYGTGKSHLAVSLGAMFAGIPAVADVVAENISAADAEIGTNIRQHNMKKNFVIVLNGMNNFSLDAEVLRCARLSLSQHGINDEVLKRLTKSYDIARYFVDRTFLIYQNQFEQAAHKAGLPLSGDALKKHLISHVENDSQVLSAINEVYIDVNGDGITWDRGLSAGDILMAIQEDLCGPGKPFNKILLLFDEFGRYIEYTAANPAIAGEAALQQIFEATQSANGKIIFVGFIQSELEAYLARIEKSSNITRYLERYRTASENLFLSSNFETILANILRKSEPDFGRIVGGAVQHYENYHHKIKNSLLRWDRVSTKKNVWVSNELYKNVILNGCYPLHPITVWLLASSHQWMQQRSTLAFAEEMIETVSQREISGFFLPYVYPYQIVDSGIFGEMLNSEEKGLVSSQYCMLYRDILVKVGDKLSDLEKTVLKAVLVINMGRMAFYDRVDALSAIQLCANLQEDEVKHALKSLEEMHGVVSFDEHAKTYDLIAEANGFNEFKRIFVKYRMGVKATISDVDETVCQLLALDVPVETSFAQSHYISSTEWTFKKYLIDSSEIHESYLKMMIRTSTESYDGETARGVLLYAYCSENMADEVSRLSQIYRELELKNYPIIIFLLDDTEKEVLAALTVKKALLKFSAADKEKFGKHIADQQRALDKKICRIITSCISKRVMIGEDGLVSYTVRINALCSQKFESLYTKAIPFVFDGFENKSKAQAKSTLTTVCCYLYNRTLMNIQVYNALSPKDKNRVNSVLSISLTHAWKVFDSHCQLVAPGNPLIAEIIDDVVQTLDDGERHNVYQLFYKFAQAPYGMNENSIFLLVSYFIAYHEKRYHYYYGTERLLPSHWSSDKGKLRIPELRKVIIQKNKNTGVDVISELCEKIMANTDVDECLQLKEKLTRLIEQEGESASNKYKIAQAYVYLDNGIRLSKMIGERYLKVRTHMDSLSQKFSILSFVKVFDMIPSVTDTIEDGLSYQYNKKYKKAIEQLQNSVQQFLSRNYMSTLEKAGCKITELSQFKVRYSQAAAILRANCFDTYADATERRIRDVETGLLAKQKYESMLVDCEKDLTQSVNVVKYQDCEEMIQKLDGWVSLVGEAKELPANIATPLLERMKYAINDIQRKKADILEDYTQTMAAVQNAETTVELKQINLKLENFLQLQLSETIQNDILNVQETIRDTLIAIDDLPHDLDALTEFVHLINTETSGCCWKAITLSAETLTTELKKQQDDWMRRFIDEAERSYTEMAAHECQSWLGKTELIPTFFQKSALERIRRVRGIVEAQLHNSRVEGLIAAYDSLTVVEKEKFRALLAER